MEEQEHKNTKKNTKCEQAVSAVLHVGDMALKLFEYVTSIPESVQYGCERYKLLPG